MRWEGVGKAMKRKDVCYIPTRDTGEQDVALISIHVLKRWYKKTNHLGYLTKDELREHIEDLRNDVLKVMANMKWVK